MFTERSMVAYGFFVFLFLILHNVIFLGIFRLSSVHGLYFGIVFFLLALAIIFRLILRNMRSVLLLLVLVLVLMLVITFLVSGSANMFFYLAPILCLLIFSSPEHIDYDKFKKLIIFLLMINIVLQLYEVITFHYVYVSPFWAGTNQILNAKLFMGSAHIIRAKGLFEGPLNNVGFCLLSAVVFYRTRLVVLLALASCALSQGRFGIITVAILFLYQVVAVKWDVRYKWFYKWAIVILMASALSALFVYGRGFSVGRFENSFNVMSSSNSTRINFWESGVERYLEYSFPYLVFGKSNLEIKAGGNSLVSMVTDNSHYENSWLQLLVDGGFLLFLIYFLPIAHVAKRTKKYFPMLILFVSVFEFPLLGTFNMIFFYWLVLLIYYDREKVGTRSRFIS